MFVHVLLAIGTIPFDSGTLIEVSFEPVPAALMPEAGSMGCNVVLKNVSTTSKHMIGDTHRGVLKLVRLVPYIARCYIRIVGK